MSRISNASQAEAIRPIHGSFLTSKSEIVRLGRRIGVGAEGAVHEIQDRSDLVAKIYHEPPPPEKAEKLVVLSRLGNERLFNLSAWPVDVLRDAPGGAVVGFVMKRISLAEELHALHSPKSRLQKFPEASWAFLIYVAANTARAVAAIHEHGFVIGDLNPKNILVTRKATVYLLDVDSFQVSADGKAYRCDGGFPEYTPPELQGVAFREVDRTQEHDGFGLAVVIFQLLFMGRHPFSGRFLGAGEMPLERAIRESRFAYGVDAEVRGMRQPPGTLALDSMPSWLVGLFRRAFLTSDRPKPREWIEPLDLLAQSLNKCVLHSGHYYYRELRECPWCGIESHARVRLFNFLIPGTGSRRGHFRLDEIWKEIQSVHKPAAPLMQRDKLLPAAEPSAEVEDFAREMRSRLILSVWCSALAGLLISLFIDSPLVLPLLIVVGLVACFFGKTRQPSTMQFLFQRPGPVSGDPLLERLQERRQQAADVAQQLQQQCDREAGYGRWGAKRDELRNLKETYENLAQIRDFKFNQLARKDQFDEFLHGFEINHPDIAGIGDNAIVKLYSLGVETAADITEERLGQIPDLNESRVRRLLHWRQELEQKFVYDPVKRVAPPFHIAVEKEIDLLRLQLEHELSGGAHYLRRVKQEIETDSQKLQPALMKARRELAQAEKDLEVASKRNPLAPILISLVIAFLIGSLLKPGPSVGPGRVIKDDGRTRRQAAPPAVSSSETAQPLGVSQAEAQSLCRQGTQLSRAEEKFEEAVKILRKAVSIDPELSEAHEELGYALYRLKRYEESVEASKEAIRLHSGFAPYYHLGLVQVATENWHGAMMAFRRATELRGPSSIWKDEYTEAYYYLGISSVRVGEALNTVQSLEHQIGISQNNALKRFELANLYLCIGNQKGAKYQYQILKDTDSALAEELTKLMKKHGVRTLV
jgi:DNA-binding helix-hairpin-helix protein with protein kinase domain/Tfp pilus assembly protein PilF